MADSEFSTPSALVWARFDALLDPFRAVALFEFAGAPARRGGPHCIDDLWLRNERCDVLWFAHGSLII